MNALQKRATLFAFLAALLYAISSPFSKLLLEHVSPTMMAAFLYLGAGGGLFLMGGVQRLTGKKTKEQPLTKKELPYTIAMVVLDIAAPVFFMFGLKATTAANASLLNNFEIVATSLIALCVFKETISKRLWGAIVLVTASSILLSIEGTDSFSFSYGSLLVLLACVCWGFENNCTRKLSSKSPAEIVVIKGIGSGLGALVLAFSVGERFPAFHYVLAALGLGFLAYGLSIYFYIYAQRGLGAAKTSTYYAVAPFVGAGLSLLIFRELPSPIFLIATLIMVGGVFLAMKDSETKQ